MNSRSPSEIWAEIEQLEHKWDQLDNQGGRESEQHDLSERIETLRAELTKLERKDGLHS
jgi:hypothetical protein